MRFSFRRRQEPRWIDTPDFAWVPQEPFGFVPGNDTGMPAAPVAEASAPGAFSPATQSPLWDGEDPSPPKAEDPVGGYQPAPRTGAACPLLWPRLAIGFGQGLALYLLMWSRSAGLAPGADPYLFSALSLMLLLAPLVLLEGLGDIEPLTLLAWTGAVAAGLTGLGLYHHWRIQGSEPSHSGFVLIILCAIMLFVAQALMRSRLIERGRTRAYRIAFKSGWSMAARLAVWAIVSGAVWVLLGRGDSLASLLRPRGMDSGFDPALVTMPLMGMASALALHLTAGRSLLMRHGRSLLMSLATVMLPLMVGVGFSLLLVHLGRAPVPAVMLLASAALLVIGINASYRGHGTRGRMRRWPEFAAAFLIIMLTALAMVALDARVAQHGWTVPRVYACAAVIVLACYGLLYGGAALVSMGGGRWMQRIEPANFAMALLLIAGCIALATPLADPARLAVDSQMQRLKSGKADPSTFDFAWLRRSGLSFGHLALLEITTGPVNGFSPDAARNAAIILSAAPGMSAATRTAPPCEDSLTALRAGLPGWRALWAAVPAQDRCSASP